MKFLFRGVVSFVVIGILSLTPLCAATPDEDDIIEQTVSPQSENYYPNLMLRFRSGDNTLTLENFHYLYYGFAYDDAYKPLAVNPHIDKLLLLAAGLDLENPHIEILRDIINVGEQALDYDPFSPKIWNLLGYAYSALGNEEKALDAASNVEMILSVIKASGGGLRQNDPQHILMFDHALDLMAAENLVHRKAAVVSRTVEFIGLMTPRKVDGVKVKGFYFDFGRIYRNKPDYVTYQKERTWQFNNLKPKEYK